MKRELFGTVVFLFVLAILATQTTISLSYDATNVSTRVNITNSMPEILAISMDSPITLVEGTTKTVFCNVTIRDYNGYNDISLVNATAYHNLTSTWNSANDNNNHYSNSSCVFNTNTDANTGIWNCAFDMQYYSNNGTWGCFVFVEDNYGYTDNATDYGSISPLYALNVTSLIDYGNMAVGDTSTSSEITNITNFGNMNINISVYGYGGDNPTSGDGLAFVCAVGNISISNERYSTTDSVWGSMNSLTNTSALIPGLTVVQQTDDLTPVVNNTYWRLYVPPNPFGQCNGTVVFEAQAP